jgi:hypothetical protein
MAGEIISECRGFKSVVRVIDVTAISARDLFEAELNETASG